MRSVLRGLAVIGLAVLALGGAAGLTVQGAGEAPEPPSIAGTSHAMITVGMPSIGQTNPRDQSALPPVFPVKVCKIGRPAYCFKYLGVCQNEGKGKCGEWFRGCLRCHKEGDACRDTIGRKDKAGGKITCESCQESWSACMDRGYRTYWPQRLGKG